MESFASAYLGETQEPQGGQEEKNTGTTENNSIETGQETEETSSQEVEGSEQEGQVSEETGETSEATEQEQPSFDINEWKELAGDEFATPAELYKAYKEKSEVPSQEVYANDFIKQLNDYAKSGLSITPEFISTISKDWAGMELNEANAKEMIATKLRLENPDFEDKEIAFMMEDKYSFDEEALRSELEDKYDDEDKVNELVEKAKERYMTKLSIDAKRARPELVKHQQSLKQPQGISQEELQAQQEAAEKQFNNELSQTMKGLDKISIPLSDGSEAEISIDKELSAKVNNAMKTLYTDPEAHWKSFGGLSEIAKMYTMYYGKESIAKQLEDRISNETTYNTVKDMRNQKPIRGEAGNQSQMKNGGGWGQLYAESLQN